MPKRPSDNPSRLPSAEARRLTDADHAAPAKGRMPKVRRMPMVPAGRRVVDGKLR